MTRFVTRVQDYLEEKTGLLLTRKNSLLTGIKIARDSKTTINVLLQTVSKSALYRNCIVNALDNVRTQAVKEINTIAALAIEYGDSMEEMPLIFAYPDAHRLREDVHSMPPLRHQPQPGIPTIGTLAHQAVGSNSLYRYDYTQYDAKSKHTVRLAVTRLSHMPVMVETGRKLAENDPIIAKALTEELTEAQLNTISGFTGMPDVQTRVCEYCGRPNAGRNRCPHAIDPRFPCPRHMPDYQSIFRHIGV